MKKNVSAFLILASFLISMLCLFSFNKRVAFAEDIFNVKSESAYLIDYDTKTVIYSKNENEKLPIASMCKIMTLNLIFDEIEKGNISLNQNIMVSQNASGMGGSQIFLDGDTEYPVSELIKGIVVASANDACVAFAENICGSEQSFVNRMNEKARELSMNNTVFTNCTGLPKVGQHSTAKDVSTMFCELLTHKDYFTFSNIWLDEIHHKKDRITQISNTNKLIRFYEGCDSGKTGYTSEAGHCLACSAKKGNMRVVSVIIKSPDSKTRFNETSKFFNYVFANYENKQIVNKNENLQETLEVSKGKKENCLIIPEENVYYFCKKGEKQSFTFELKLEEKVVAPINKGETIGKLIIYKDGIELKRINMLSNEKVERNRFIDYFKQIAKSWTIIR